MKKNKSCSISNSMRRVEYHANKEPFLEWVVYSYFDDEKGYLHDGGHTRGTANYSLKASISGRDSRVSFVNAQHL